ncbi:Histone acetyltransferase type B catalytic subunit, partial [Penicillium rolfsii]
CDRLDPVCSQCKRAGKPCGGYRDVPSFLFRDENDKTARRSAAAKARSEAQRKLLDSSDSLDQFPGNFTNRPDSSRWNYVTQPKNTRKGIVSTMPAVVPSTLEEQGLRFFFNRFVSAFSGMAGDLPSELETPPFLKAILMQSPLRDATISVGLAAMSNVSQDRALALAAREKYVAAIHVVRKAVQNPHQANANQIVHMIVMLSMYEMVCCAPNEIDSWTVHLDGVAALVKQAGLSDVLRNTDPRPHLQYYFILIIRYFLVQGVIPSELHDWSPEHIPGTQPDQFPTVCLVGILIRFMKLHSAIRNHPNPDPRTAANSALLCDAELEVWESQLPKKWRFSLKKCNDSHHSFNGTYMIYNDVWVSRDLNHYFWARLMVNEMIVRHISRLEMPTLDDIDQRQRALDIISLMATYICAGAASQMGAFGDGLPFTRPTQLPPLNGAFMLMFPLAVAGGAAGAGDHVHEWVLQTLQKMGRTMGIRRALELIPTLKEVRNTEAVPDAVRRAAFWHPHIFSSASPLHLEPFHSLATMALEDEWTCDANDALQITVMQPGDAKPKTLSAFHPQFTYPIFGDEEQIFGYKGLIIRLRFAAHDLRPHVHISYDDRFKAVGDIAATDLLGTLKEFLPEEALINLSDYEKAVQEDSSAKDFTPPGKLVYSYESNKRNYEIWAGSLADPDVRRILGRAQILVSLFIEAGTPLAMDDPEWTLERWTVYFVYEKVTPPTPTASSYSIVGYATTYRYWLYQRDRSITPTVKNDTFPPAEIKLSELPSRLRIAQFLILPSHHRAGHGTHLYTTIHASCIADPTIIELTVEDPNESFDALRDTADFCLLQPEFVKRKVHLNPDPKGAYSRKQRLRSVPTAELIPTDVLREIRASFKIEATQFAHILEMYLLSQIPPSHRLAGGTNLARLLIKKGKADDPNDRRYYWWRMLIKQRLFKKHKELLQELELIDRVEKLDDTVRNVEEGYEITLKAVEGRLPGAADGEAPAPLASRNKRKLAIEDDEDEDENGSEAGKRPKV